MRSSLVVAVAVVIAACHGNDPAKGAPDAAIFLPAEAPGAKALAPVTIVFENPSSRSLYLLPGCASEFTVLPETGGYPGRVGRRELCLCECGVCQSAPDCQERCAAAGSKQVPPRGEVRLQWIPRSYELMAQPTFPCQHVQALPPGRYRLWAVVYDSPSLEVGWTGVPTFGVRKDFELPVTGGELRVPLIDPGADGAHCTALATCCPKLPIPEYVATCKSIVVDAIQTRCQEALASYLRGSTCN